MKSVIAVILMVITGCSRTNTPEFPPSLSDLYVKADIDGVYSTRPGLDGSDIAIQHIERNEYIITAQKWSDIGASQRSSVKGMLINGIMQLDGTLHLPTLDEFEDVGYLCIININSKPVVTANQFYSPRDINHNNANDLFYRPLDFPEGVPEFKVMDNDVKSESTSLPNQALKPSE